ncbi:DMT family transporter [Shinella zoogloeoides]|uniref:EamA family transporter n=1 Tax=Shinella zoogloeoides TaxID=352475 RepID=A0A6N8TM64_SHIZO|nr:DMT family transporter [Shinella zoogloeoides]MXO02214.1 EamA family transporter [Shinella zoogloeoides]UEX80348.1 DMT family transporter [Shinella zoogloeoides]
MSLDRLAPAIFVLLWSTGWVVAKFAALLSEPLTFLCIRYLTAAVLFAGLCVASGVSWPRDRRTILHAIVSGVFLHGIYLGAVWWAIGEGVPAALSSIIAALQPLMTALAAPFFIGERLSTTQKLGLCLGFLGVLIAVLPKFFGQGAAEIPALAILVNMLGMAAVTYGTIYQKQHLQTGDIRAVATLQYVGALIVTLPLALGLETPHVEISFAFIALLPWAVLGISMGAILLLLYLIRRGQVSRAASLIYLVPPIAALQAAAIFGEELTMPMILGTVIVVAGVYLTNRKDAAPAE